MTQDHAMCHVIHVSTLVATHCNAEIPILAIPCVACVHASGREISLRTQIFTIKIKCNVTQALASICEPALSDDHYSLRYSSGNTYIG